MNSCIFYYTVQILYGFTFELFRNTFNELVEFVHILAWVVPFQLANHKVGGDVCQ